MIRLMGRVMLKKRLWLKGQANNCSRGLQGKYYSTHLTTPVEVGDDDGITYQRDITIENIKELTDIFLADPNMGQAHVFSENNIKATTIASEFPWSTARTLDGELIGCVISSKCGDFFWRSTGLFVKPEYRHKEVGPKLFRYANAEALTRYPLCNAQYMVRDGVFVTQNSWPNEKVDEQLSARIGPADKYNPNNLPESAAGISIVPFQRGVLFDKLVYWDTSRVHWIPRPVFLKALLTPGVVDCYVALDDKTEEVVGYGSIQLAFNPKSHILGPLYGENDEIALVLLRKLMEHYIPGNNIGVMHFDRNEAIGQAIEDMGVGVKVKADNRYTGMIHPEKFKNQVYLFSNCGLQFY